MSSSQVSCSESGVTWELVLIVGTLGIFYFVSAHWPMVLMMIERHEIALKPPRNEWRALKETDEQVLVMTQSCSCRYRSTELLRIIL